MKTMILAAIAALSLGMGTAVAQGEGGPTASALDWQAANGNPSISGTKWFALSPAARAARVQQLQQQAAAAIFGTPSGSAVAQSSTNPRS